MLAELCNITSDGIKWQLKSLQDKGILRRIGPDRGGHWEINESTNVIPNRQNDISVDVLDGGLAERILEELNYNPMITQVYLAQKLELPVRTLQREINNLAAAGIIVRVGGKRFGHWKVNK